MAERYLIDTSAVIKYLNETFSDAGLLFMDSVLNDASIISFVSEIELQAWNPNDEDDLQVYRLFIARSSVLGVNDAIIQETIRIRRTYKLKLPDALIAAITLINGLTLIADNDKDFGRVSELKFVNPNALH